MVTATIFTQALHLVVVALLIAVIEIITVIAIIIAIIVAIAGVIITDDNPSTRGQTVTGTLLL